MLPVANQSRQGYSITRLQNMKAKSNFYYLPSRMRDPARWQVQGRAPCTAPKGTPPAGCQLPAQYMTQRRELQVRHGVLVHEWSQHAAWACSTTHCSYGSSFDKQWDLGQGFMLACRGTSWPSSPSLTPALSTSSKSKTPVVRERCAAHKPLSRRSTSVTSAVARRLTAAPACALLSATSGGTAWSGAVPGSGVAGKTSKAALCPA